MSDDFALIKNVTRQLLALQSIQKHAKLLMEKKTFFYLPRFIR